MLISAAFSITIHSDTDFIDVIPLPLTKKHEVFSVVGSGNHICNHFRQTAWEDH